MRLTPWEEERLLVFAAAELARRHRSAGLALNAPEAVALMCDAMLETARQGATYDEVEAAGLAAVDPAEVLPGVRELVDLVSLEVLLGDGTRLVVLVDPLGRGTAPGADGPGAVVPAQPAPSADADDRGAPTRERRRLDVRNASRRVVRVSSHFPFHRVNPASSSTGPRHRASGSTSTPDRRSAGRPARPGPSRSSGSAAPRARGRESPLPGGAPGALRPHRRRPHPAGRHGPLDPRRGGPPGAR